MAKGLLLSSIFDPNPVVILEHRWLHQQVGEVPEGDVRVPLGQVNRVLEGRDVTLVATSTMTIEAILACRLLAKVGITCDLFDLSTITPSDWSPLEASVRRTGRLVALEVGVGRFSVSSEVVAHLSMHCFDALKAAPALLGSPYHPLPTSPALSEGYYPRAAEIVASVLQLVGGGERHGALVEEARALAAERPHDVPGDWFKGPF
jgi:pyruvate dehydrogenase E1 component beta subunit